MSGLTRKPDLQCGHRNNGTSGGWETTSRAPRAGLGDGHEIWSSTLCVQKF